jgi:hypothetical protein
MAVALPGDYSIDAALKAAIPILHQAKEQTKGWTNIPVCPRCLGVLTKWTEGEPGHERAYWFCSACDEETEVETKYRVKT